MMKHSCTTKRLSYFLLYAVLLSFGLFKMSVAETCDLSYDSLVSNSIALSGHTIWKSNASDKVECAKLCVKRKNCKSFNFDLESKLCELNEAVLADGGTTRTGDNLVYSDIAVWPSQIDPDCFDRPCGEDEVCIPGQLTGGQTCSYSCFKLPFKCPPPEGTGSSQPRTVGSIFVHTCDRGYVGGDSALCLSTGQWNKTLDTACSLLYGSSCTTDADCGPINGTCFDNTCHCNGSYDASTLYCVPECEAGWLEFEQKCYMLMMTEMQYLDAREFCVSHDSQLVQVDSAAENDFLKDEMRRLSPPQFGYWNDLFEVTTNGNERWRTSNDSYDPSVGGWIGGGSDDYNGNKESCTVFWERLDYSWVDIGCANDVRTDGMINALEYLAFRPVCKKDPDVNVTYVLPC